MTKDRRLGLDELMIVNPSSSRPDTMFIGEDGTLYQMHGLSEEQPLQELGQYFLADDGSLYQMQGVDADGSSELGGGAGGFGEGDVSALGQYFLGADGALYGVVR